jgi:hypothetical protein
MSKRFATKQWDNESASPGIQQRAEMRGASRRLAPLLLLLAALTLAACGSSGHTRLSASTGEGKTSSQPTPRARPRMFADYDDDDYLNGYQDEDPDDHHEPKDRDGDIDAQPSTGYYDGDDSAVRYYGRPASSSERRSIVALAHRYYDAAARDDGAAICPLVYRPLARSYVQQFGVDGPHYLRGLRSCPAIASKFFAGATRMRAFAARLGITDVRVSGNVALVVLGLPPFPIRVFQAIREQGKWYVFGSLDSEMP